MIQLAYPLGLLALLAIPALIALYLLRPRPRRILVSTLNLWQAALRDRRLEAQPRLSVPFASLAPLTGAKGFNGSALVFMPGGKSLAMVAGPQQVFAEVGLDGGTLTGGALDRAAQPQPEGMAFLPDGTLLVGSEGAKGQASISSYAPSRTR